MKKRLERFPLWGQVLYSSGALGWTMADRIWVTFMVYFYLPPKESGMPELINNVTFWGVLTVAGLAHIFGRSIDAISNPLVASWSDRSRSKMGRRKKFLIWGGLPLMLATALLFFPSMGATALNGVYMAVMLGCLLFFTFYVAPWLALIPELSHTDRERMNIVTIQAIFTLAASVIVMVGGYVLWGALEGTGIEKGRALQLAVVIMAAFGLIFCYLAVIPIDEKRYCASVPSEMGMIESMKLTLSNRAFLPYLFGAICLTFGINIVSQAATYYVTVILRREEAFAGTLFAVIFGVALVAFFLINLLTRYVLKKTVMMISLGIFGVCACLLYWMGTDAIPFPPVVQAFCILGLIGIPVAAVMILPNAMISDVAQYDAIRTGTNREAMYFGVQGIFEKINLGISSVTLVFLLSTFGKDIARPLGIKISGPVTGVVALVGIIIFIFYPERKIMELLDRHRMEAGEGVAAEKIR